MRPDYNLFFFGHTSAHIWKTNSTLKRQSLYRIKEDIAWSQWAGPIIVPWVILQ